MTRTAETNLPTLSRPMLELLTALGTNRSAWSALHGKKNADRTVTALVARGLVSVERTGVYGELRVTELGRAALGAASLDRLPA